MELIIVVSIIVIVASIAIPNLIASRLAANESAAASLIRTVTTAEAQFQKSGKADEDNDAQGEYGTFAEMGGRVGVRGLSEKVPTDLTQSMSLVNAAGEVARSGYYFRLYLPGPGGVGQRERPLGGISTGVTDPNLAEFAWACYAWPANYGISGRRTWFVNQVGEILSADDEMNTESNTAHVRGGDAFLTSSPDNITGQLAIGTAGADGNVWKPLN